MAIGRRGPAPGEGLDPSPWSNGPGDRYAAHEHGYDKVIVVERGSIAFGLPGDRRTVELAAGDRLELPGRDRPRRGGRAGRRDLLGGAPARRAGSIAVGRVAAPGSGDEARPAGRPASRRPESMKPRNGVRGFVG